MKILIILSYLTSICFSSVNAQFSFENIDTGKRESVNLTQTAFPTRPYNPIVGKIKNLALGHVNGCVIDDEGEKCWPERVRANEDLRNPNKFAARDYRTCGIFDDGIKCRDYRDMPFKKIEVPMNLKNPSQITIGDKHTCVIDDEGVKCWGDNSKGQTAVPTFSKKPISISAGSDFTCALFDNSLKCWGIVGYTFREAGHEWLFPDYSRGQKPKMVAAGEDHACILFENFVKCMANNDFWDQENVPKNLKNPTMLVAEGNRSCVVDEDRIKCWGAKGGYVTPPINPLINPKKIVSGLNHSCALDDEGVKCWGDNSFGQTSARVGLVNPKDIFAGFNNTCVIDDEGLKCWGDNKYRQVWIPEDVKRDLKNPKMVSVGLYHICATGENGVKCWGGDYYGQLAAPYLSNTKIFITEEKHTCAIDQSGLKCWGDINVQFSFDQSKYFYVEKSAPLKYAQGILNNVEDTSENEFSLFYLREKITELFLIGTQTDISPTIISNSKSIRQLYQDNQLVTEGVLAERNTTQLRFILDVMANTLVSSKYLLSDNSKIITEKLKIEFANLLASDEINADQASALINDLLNEKSLMNEMQSSYRLAGIKAFYDWAQSYVTTGKVD